MCFIIDDIDICECTSKLLLHFKILGEEPNIHPEPKFACNHSVLVYQTTECVQTLFMQALDLNVADLQMYGNVTWLNTSEELGKLKKGTELLTLLFVFRAAVVVIVQERVRGKKKPRVRVIKMDTFYFLTGLSYLHHNKCTLHVNHCHC